jgi:hypothetical protein
MNKYLLIIHLLFTQLLFKSNSIQLRIAEIKVSLNLTSKYFIQFFHLIGFNIFKFKLLTGFFVVKWYILVLTIGGISIKLDL